MRNNSIWVGLIGVIAEAKSETLGESKGAYVNVATKANSKEDFLSKVSLECHNLNLYLVEEENVETLEERAKVGYLSDEIQTISDLAKTKDKVFWGTFHTYTHDDG